MVTGSQPFNSSVFFCFLKVVLCFAVVHSERKNSVKQSNYHRRANIILFFRRGISFTLICFVFTLKPKRRGLRKFEKLKFPIELYAPRVRGLELSRLVELRRKTTHFGCWLRLPIIHRACRIFFHAQHARQAKRKIMRRQWPIIDGRSRLFSIDTGLTIV